MESSPEVDAIHVTYYVNPHEIYFRFENDSQGDDVLNFVNAKIQKYVKQNIENKRPDYYSPQIGEIVLLHYMTDCVMKWIRVRVDSKSNKNKFEKEKFILWAIDYGFPIESEIRWIRCLRSDELNVMNSGLIRKGGIYKVVPCTAVRENATSVLEFKKTNKWSQKAIEFVEKLISKAKRINFKREAQYKDHIFGSFIIQTNEDKNVAAEEFLINMREGVNTSSFEKDFTQLDSTPYWERPKQDSLFKIYENNSDFNLNSLEACDETFEVGVPILIDMNISKTDGMLAQLADRFDEDIRLPPEKEKVSSVLSLDTAKLNGTNKETFSRVPLGQRFAKALQKYEARKKTVQRNSTRMDEVNKKLMAKSFPAGFIVDNQAIADRDAALSATMEKHRFAKEECFPMSQIQHVLVHDHQNIQIAPVEEIHQVNFSLEIHSALKDLNITQTYRIQKVGWPRILRGFSLIIVNNGRAGTTWTYLPAVCSLLIERVQDERIVDGCGPLSIIACASYEEVNEIERRCRHLLRYTNGIKCFKACGFYEDDIVLSQLLNGTEIMVTTVPCLYRLMTHRLQLFNHKRILSLVFDNIDLISKNFRQEICQIYQLCDNDVQTIITSKTWSTLLEHFYIESDRFALCIGSYVEAAVYGRTEMVVEYLSQELKFSKLMSYLCGLNYALELTVLVFSELKDLQRTWKRLQCTPIKFWKCHDNMDSLEILKIKKAIQSCRPGEFKMLICTDETLADLNVCRANHIVHCTLPATWTLFVKRFSVLLGSHENLLTRKRNNKSKTTSIVFVDEKNNKELPRLIEFMEIRGNCDIPENVLNLAELSRMKNEESQTNMYKPFCKRLLTIGICHGQINCPDRHTITKLDRSRSDIPLSGYVKFDILRINSPVHFTVRLRQHRDTNESKWKNCQSSNSVSAFQFRLMKYFEDVNNHVIHFPFDLGNICIVSTDADGGKCYSRGKIVKIEENKHMGILHRQRIEVLLVDSNQIVSCYSTDLLELPEKFKNFPHQAVDVRIAGIRPQDFDSEWDPKIMVQVIKWIRNQNYAYCQGFIKLSIMNTLWLESVEVIEILHSVTEEIRAVSIKHNLIKGNFCVKDTKPFELLTALADKAELLKPPKDVRTSKSTQPADKVFYNSDTSSIDLDESNDVSLLNWTSTDDDSETSNKPSYKLLKHSSTASAHEEELLCLSKDVWDELALDKFNKVLLCNFYHPNRIYIRNFDSSSRLMELHREIDEFAALPENLTTLTDNTLAQNCLAKINDEFRRAKILKLFHETDYVTAEVFFVDLGEFLMIPTNELFEIPQHFITTLPFQAIFCALIGICPIDSESWCDTICDDIYDNFLGNQSYVYVRSVQPGGPDKYAYGLKSSSYRVVLRDETQDVNVNNWIVTNNFGKFDPSTKHWIDADVGEYAPENEVDFDFEGHYDVQFDEEDLIKFIQAAYGDEQAEKCPAVREETDKEQAKPSPLVDATPDSGIYSAENSLTAMNNPIIELVSVFKFPKIKWHQLDSLIVLTIYAPDVKDYYLKVKARFVYVYFEIEDMKFAAALNLFGCVNSERTSHEIRGLNIVVRLTKTLSKLSWPRLVQAKEKCHWLHYNLDNLRDKPKNFDRKETKKQFVAECSDTSSTDGEFDDELDADSDSYCGSDNETENQQFE